MKEDKYKQDRQQIETLRTGKIKWTLTTQKAYNDFLIQVRECELAYQYGRRPPDRLLTLKNLRRALNDLILAYTPHQRVNQQLGKFRLRATLAEIFIPAGKMNFRTLLRELQRHGYMSDNELYMTGKQIRSLYKFLVKEKIITPLPTMTDVFAAFEASFKLQVKGATSLWRYKDEDKEIEAWRKVFFIAKK